MPLVGSSFREYARASTEMLQVETPRQEPDLVWPIRLPRARSLAIAILLLASLAALEWYHELDYSLGVFYAFPMLFFGMVCSRGQIVAAALGCALLRGQFMDELPLIEYWLRFSMATLAYAGIGLLVFELSQRRQRVIDAHLRLQAEQTMRYQAEDQLRLLAESSPAAIVTLNSRAEVLGANRAMAQLLGYESTDSMEGHSLAEQVPLFASALRKSPGGLPMRASATSWARRLNGQVFPITVWFSTYGEGSARCLAGILVDTSEEIRDREREAFRHFLDYNRLFAGSLAHEIRNMCSAIRVVLTNLSQRVALEGDEDFRALRSLVDGLVRISAFELEAEKEPKLRSTDLHQILDQLRVVIEPDWVDINGEIAWQLEDVTLRVPADAHALLQVFLNLTQNSLRAVQHSPDPRLEISARRDGTMVVVSVTDSGSGVKDTSVLFQPFRENADGSGLGLYISRALARTFGGDLRFVPVDAGCRFDVVLPLEPVSPSAS